MEFDTVVRAVVADRPSIGLPGITVQLHDRDASGADDLLGSGTTGVDGRVRLRYAVSRYLDAEDAGVPGVLPDLYAVVVDSAGARVSSTRDATVDNRLLPEIVVPVTREEIARHRLLGSKPRQSAKDAERTWIARWKKPAPGQPPKPPGSLCIARVAADVLASLDAPQTDLQKRAAKALSGSPKEHLRGAAKLGRRVRDMIDATGRASADCNADLDPKDLWQLLVGPSGPLNTMSQALLEVEPSPYDDLGPVRAGRARETLYDGWNDKCVQHFRAGTMVGTMAAGLPDMQRYYHEPNDLVVLEPVRLDSVAVYSPVFKHRVRVADPATRTVQMWRFDPVDGLVPHTLATDVPTGGNEALVDLADPRTGRQVLVVDVQGGQTVTLSGAGFISAQARLSVLYAEWEDVPANASEAVALKPRPFRLASGWPDTLDVHGSVDYGADKIVFDWPAAAMRPGLYQLRLDFDNDTGRKTLVRDQQDPFTCTLGLVDQVSTPVLFFAVLPAVTPRTVKVEATRVDVLDLTDPEELPGTPPGFTWPWPDDVALTGAIQFSRVRYAFDGGPAAPAARLVRVDQSTHGFDKGDKVRWAGESFAPSDPNLLPDNEITHNFDFARDYLDLVTISLTASEIEGDFDRGLLEFMGKAALVVLGVIATAAVLGMALMLVTSIVVAGGVAAAVIIVAAIFTWWGFTWGPAGVALGADAAVVAALIGIVATVTGALIGVIWTAVFGSFPIVDAAVSALITGNDAVASAALVLTGPELAIRMSAVRFHRVVYPVGHNVSGLVDATTASDPHGLHDTYTGGAHGGRYRIHLDLVAA